MEKSSSKEWYIFYCRSRAEKKALEMLLEEGYEAYLPLVTEVHIWSDRKKKVKVPMFKGYIFVYINNYQVYNVAQNFHIVGPLKIGNEFGRLRQENIDLLKKIELHGISASAVPLKINEGNNVKITSGPLKGYTGICLKKLGEKHIHIAFEEINQSLKLKIPNSEVELI
jgi:transcription termination/antitermination protein NusG